MNDWRRGWQAMPKPGRHVAAGSRRAVIDGVADVPLPFGWLVLCPDAPGVRAWLAKRTPEPRGGASPPTVRQPHAPPAPPAAPPPPRRAFLDGEPVAIVRKDRDQILIRFCTGDTDWVTEAEIEYR